MTEPARLGPSEASAMAPTLAATCCSMSQAVCDVSRLGGSGASAPGGT